ncbi:hypothetical protein [Pontibacter pudoricolor]|uniref:hypothetical protein n=1 Tax=Pontibacter pudoricolor TaxID=2694930 RepID=UPI001391547B|nr:hypothetical protein [Pontibacter pudoricolor]
MQLNAAAQTVTWVGGNSRWDLTSNWSPQIIPNSGTNVIIPAIGGQVKAPVVNLNAMGECLSLTIQSGGSLWVSNDKGMTIHGDVTINSGATFTNDGTKIDIKGNWTNNGTYAEEIYVRGQSETARSNVNPYMTFSGTGKTIGGSSTSTFSNLTISGSITLNSKLATARLTKNQVFADPQLRVTGSLDPQTYLVTLASGATLNPFVIDPNATIYVKAANYYSNYNLTPALMYATSVINYASTGDQTIESDISYQILKVSGSGEKSLEANTTMMSTTTDVQVQVLAGILNLGDYTLNRTPADGKLSIASGATLRIGGNKSFPGNYPIRTFEVNSTVEYNGTAQTVTPLTSPDYWHLKLSGTNTKLLPGPMAVRGDVTVSGNTTVIANSAAALTIDGNLSIGSGSTFNGDGNTHTIAGNWINNGTFNPGGGL